jgi:hypothetical protein
VDKVALGQVFSEYFGFLYQFSFHQLLHTHHLSSGAGTIGPIVADVPSGLSFTPPEENKKNYFLSIRFKYSPLHYVLRHPESMFFPQLYKTNKIIVLQGYISIV